MELSGRVFSKASAAEQGWRAWRAEGNGRAEQA